MVGVQLVDGYSMRSGTFRGCRYDWVIAQYNGVDIWLGNNVIGIMILGSSLPHKLGETTAHY